MMRSADRDTVVELAALRGLQVRKAYALLISVHVRKTPPSLDPRQARNLSRSDQKAGRRR